MTKNSKGSQIGMKVYIGLNIHVVAISGFHLLYDLWFLIM